MSVSSAGPYKLSSAAIGEADRIVSLGLPGEDRSEMRAELNRWFAFYGATSPIVIWMIASAYFAWFKLRRIHVCAAATRMMASHDAQDSWDDAQFEKVRKHQEKLAHLPADAVRELAGFAAGCRWMINRWQRLKGRLEKEGTLYGADRDEAIRLQGGVPVFERLGESEAAWMTWGYCLFAQPQPNHEDVQAYVAFLGTRLPPSGAKLAKPSDIPGMCRDWLLARIERELTTLRQREERLWVEHEQPARTARIEQALATVEGTLRKLARYEREEKKSLKQMLAGVVRECKRIGAPLPRGVPYEPV